MASRHCQCWIDPHSGHVAVCCEACLAREERRRQARRVYNGCRPARGPVMRSLPRYTSPKKAR